MLTGFVKARALFRFRLTYSGAVRHKYLILVLWAALLLGLWVHTSQQGRPPTLLLRDSLTALRGDPLAPLWLLAVYLVRPLLLLPVSLLTVATGAVFGAVWGTVYATLATLLSVVVAYSVGRRFGTALPDEPGAGWSKRLRSYPFETVLLSRFLFVPGDLVNYVSGYLKINLPAFLGATLIGGTPGLLVGVLAGASLEPEATSFSLNPGYLLASAGLLLVSLGVSWWVRRRAALSGAPVAVEE